MNQQEVYNDIMDTRDDIKRLAAFVQNDFMKMLDDGTTTPDNILCERSFMICQFEKTIKRLKYLKESCANIMGEFVDSVFCDVPRIMFKNYRYTIMVYCEIKTNYDGVKLCIGNNTYVMNELKPKKKCAFRGRIFKTNICVDDYTCGDYGAWVTCSKGTKELLSRPLDFITITEE